MNILALCGSNRSHSSNHALLEAVRKLLPSGVTWSLFAINSLPFFAPDIQFAKNLPPKVEELRQLALKADLILISTPEYAHGIPGILKNALEWLVAEESMQKPVALIIGSPSGGEYVKQHLTETLKTMDLLPSDDLTIVVKTARHQISESGVVLGSKLRDELTGFAATICQRP